NGHPNRSGRLCQRGAQRHAARGLPACLTRLTTRFTRLRFVDRDDTATEFFALKPLNGGSGRLAVRHLDEAKPTWAASIAIGNEIYLVHNSILLEELAEVMVRSAIRQIANEDIHGSFPL